MAQENLMLEKVPPQNIEAEVAALGSMLLEQEAISYASETIDGSYFYNDAHKKIFNAMIELYGANKPVDLVTLTEELKKKGWLEEVGGPAYLAGLTTAVPTAANVEHYCKIVREKALLRNLIDTATNIVAEGYEAEGDADGLVDKAEKLIFEIASRKIKGGFIQIKDVVKESIEQIDRLYQKKEYITGIATGFHDLDQMTSGLQPSDFIVVAGRPSMGKSALVSCICEYVAVVEKLPIAVFSLEMSKEHLVQRMLCSHARVNAQSVRSGFLAQSDWPRLTAAAGKISESKIFIDDSPGIGVMEVRAKARRLKAAHDIKLIALDYLQLMQGSARTDSRQQEISDISRALKALARELNVPLIAVSQLSRAPERREDNRPRLSDLRESGAIEQDADLVLLLFREEYYNPTDENKGVADIIIAKQRNGPVGSKSLAFIKEYTRFENLSRLEA